MILTLRRELPLSLLLLAGCPDSDELATANTPDGTSGSTGGSTTAAPVTSGGDSSATSTSTWPGTGTTETTSGIDSMPGSGTTGSETTGSGTTDGTTGSDTTGGADTTSTGTTGGSDTTSSGTTGEPGSTSSGTTGEPGSTDTSSDTTSSDTTGSGTTGEPGTTGASGTTGDSDSEGEGEDAWCCEPGCSIPLMQTHIGKVAVQHDGTLITTYDQAKRLRLWVASVLAEILVVDDVDEHLLVGGTLVYEKAGQLHIVDAWNAVELAACPTDTQWGVARDGGYVWTAGAAGVELLELDCSLRWSAAGSLADAKILATADALHVYDADLGAQTVTHFDATDGSASEAEFLGTFASWFADVPRYWATQGPAYRVYDLDNSLVKFTTGLPKYGWGTRLAGNGTMYDLFDPADKANYDPTTHEYSGGAILSSEQDEVRLIRMDVDPPTEQVVKPVCCVNDFSGWDFAFSGGAWVVGGVNGYVADHLGKFVSDPQALYLEGGQAGRVAVGLADARVYLYDLTDDCELTALPMFKRKGGGTMRMSGNGALLVSSEGYYYQNNQGWFAASRLYTLPDGVVIGEYPVGLHSDGLGDHDFADDGMYWSRLKSNAYYTAEIYKTLITGWGYNQSNVLPRFSPDSGHYATSDGSHWVWSWAEAHTTIYATNPSKLVGVAEGVVHGFIDEEHLLVGRYAYADLKSYFIAMDIVALDGTVVQTTNLPEIRRVMHIETGEILVEIHPTKQGAIYNAFTGEKLWTAPPKARVAVVGPDHIATSDAAGVQIIKWR